MEIDGEKTSAHLSRSLRARNSLPDGRPNEPRKASTAKNSKTRASGSGSQPITNAASNGSATSRKGAVAPASNAANEITSRSHIARSPASETSRESTDDGPIQRSYPSGRKGHRSDEVNNQAPHSGVRDQTGSTTSRVTSTASSRKGKGKAAEASAPTKQAALSGSKKAKSTSSLKKSSASTGHPKPSASKKRTADVGPADTPTRQERSKRQKQSGSGSSPYNLRSKHTQDGSAGSSSSGSSGATTQASDMAPRKGSGDFSLTRGGGASQQGAGSGSPAAKGKGKAKGGRASRSKNYRDSDDLGCSNEGFDHGFDDHEATATSEGILQSEDDDVTMEDADKANEQPRAKGGRKGQSQGQQDSALEEQKDDCVEDEEGCDDFGTLEDDGDGDDGEDQFEDDDDEEEEDPYGEARDDAGGGAFGLNLRAMAGYMSGLTGRFRSLLASLKDGSDPTTQLVALQELSELLSVSTEDTLAGYFPTESFVKELIYIMGGPKPTDGRAAKSRGPDEDEEMAAAIAAAAAADFEEDSGEKMLLACRCLANLIEAMPYTAHSVVSHGAIPVLNSKLMEITFIDLAEQVLQTLEKISQDFPSAIVKEGGLTAILQYLDFFNIHIQRTAMTAASNCCRKLSVDSFSMVKDVMPTIQNVLGYSDQRLVESACKCVVRTVESYRHQPELLEQLLTPDLLSAVNELLLPNSSSGKGSANASLGANTYTDVLKALGTACRASPKVAVTLLENNIVETLYHLLTGSPAPSAKENGAADPSSIRVPALAPEGADSGCAEAAPVAVIDDLQGTAAIADMAVLQNLAQRPKEQVQEALSLIGELLPPLPRDGVFDPRAYTEKAYLKRKSQESRGRRKDSGSAKSEDGGSKKEAAGASDAPSGAASASGRSDASPSNAANSVSPSRPTRPRSEREASKEAAQAARVEMLNERKEVVQRFTRLVLPTLVGVYAASVAPHVRSKAINGILKILSFVEPEPLAQALDNVPLAGFVAAILSSRDNPSLVHGALQIVELLTIKLPHIYTALLRREGVMWEIDSIASQEPTHRRPSKASEGSGSNKTEPSQPQPQPQPSALSLPSGASAVEEAMTSSGLARLLGAASSIEGLTSSSLTLGSIAISRLPSAAQSLADANDANIWRARLLHSKLSEQAASSDGARKAVEALDRIKSLVHKLEPGTENDESAIRSTADEIAALFLRPDEPISSFELLRSGLVEGLYAFATKSSSEGLPLERRRIILIESLMQTDEAGTTAASVLVRRLQESLSRLENVQITTALSGGSDDSRRSATSMLGRQLRLRLVAEDAGSEIPRSCTNIVVTIHAVATFQSLNDYLRPKIASAAASAASAGASGSSSSRLSSVLAAFAAATSSGAFPDLSDRTTAASSTRAGEATSTPQKEIKAKAPASKEEAEASGSVSETKKASPRRSSRLSKAGKADATTSQQQDAATDQGTDGDDSGESDAKKPRADSNGNDDPSARPEAGASDDTRAIAERLFGDAAEGESDEALARRLMDGLLHDGFVDEEGFSDEEFDDEILQSEITADAPSQLLGEDAEAGDKTINLDVDKEAGQVVAKTPEGTQVPSPRNGSSTPGHSASASASPSKPSYASALQKKPSDWHLEFSLDEQPLSLDSTVYGAIHRFETSPARSGTGSGAESNRYIWGNVYTVKYKKVTGAVPKANEDGTPEPRDVTSAAVELPASVGADAPYAKLLQMLAVLHGLNTSWREMQRSGTDSPAEFGSRAPALKESAFVNNKLTAKLNRQLEEPMIVASSCLPAWSMELPKVFPFLFPFEARYSFLQSTAFGYARLITRWQSLHSRNQDNSSSSLRMDDSFGFLGRLQRQKVRISRSSLLPSAFKVLELYGSTSSVLEVEYFEEVGTGLGPTLEFYSLVSKEFARKDLDLWRDDDATGTDSEYVRSPNGLFPAVFDESLLDSAESRKRIHAFKILGQFVAKALLDSRIIDCNFSPVFIRAVLNQPMTPSLNTLSAVDPTLSRSLRSLQRMPSEDLAGLALDFTVPGYPDIELHHGGQCETVDASNLDRYISEVLAITLDSGIKPAVRAFRQGFNLIFPITAMSSFTAEELVMLFGNTEEDWSEATLMSSIKPDHGLTAESPSFKDIVAIMSSFNVAERRDFLQWLTGSPKLPIGGFAGLHPQLTVVKRPHEPPLTPDDYLPSVMTCVNYLKMPLYTSRDKMRRRLEMAMKEGSTSFHLS
ncbi:Ubiquitin fusion degradation protein 4 [Thecaphora frezii]